MPTLRKTDPTLSGLILTLKKKGWEDEAPLWRDVAKRLEKPLRSHAEVNLSRIARVLGESETALVPGKVLGSGEVSRPIRVAAWKFSKEARRKIEKAGGQCLTLEELEKENPRGTNVRIIG